MIRCAFTLTLRATSKFKRGRGSRRPRWERRAGVWRKPAQVGPRSPAISTASASYNLPRTFPSSSDRLRFQLQILPAPLQFILLVVHISLLAGNRVACASSASKPPPPPPASPLPFFSTACPPRRSDGTPPRPRMASASRALAPSQEVLFDDLYREILLRVPADRPQRLIRFALVSKAWRRVLADPDFHRRYLEFHNMPPLIGYILNCTDFRGQFARLVSTTRPPFSARLPRNGAHLVAEDSRHGRVLFSSTSGREKDYVLIVWDPVTDHQQEVRLPETFPIHIPGFKIAVLCDVRDCDHRRCHGGPFRLVFVGPDGWPGFDYKWEVPALVYTSASGAWTDSPAGFATNVNGDDDWGFRGTPPALLGSALYFLSSRILQYRFGSEGERLMYIDVPEGYVGKGKDCGVVIMPAADGRLGLAAMYSDRINTRIHIWETEIGAGGEVHWVEKARMPVRGYNLLGVAASHALFIRTTVNGVRCIDLESGKFQNFEKLDSCQTYSLVPLLSFDTPDPHPASDGDDPKGEKASSSASTSRIGHGLKH